MCELSAAPSPLAAAAHELLVTLSLSSVDFLVIVVSLITLALETDPTYEFLVVIRPIKLIRY